MESDLKSSELQHNFIKDRINSIGKHFVEINSKLSSYNNKIANTRDCGDEVAKSISSFASKENCNQTLRLGLGEFSDVLYSIQEYRDAEVHRMQVKVVHELDSYTAICKQTKADIKKCFDARMKELKKKNDLEKARSKNPSNWQKIAQAEKEVNQAQEDAAQMAQSMGRLVNRFERKKIEDLKHIFLEFVKIEMIFHAKALELYSKAHNILERIQVEEDLHEFNSYFKAHASSLDVEALSPPQRTTTSQNVDENNETSVLLSYKPQALKGVQGTQRSVFTLKTPMVPTVKSESSSESFIDT